MNKYLLLLTFTLCFFITKGQTGFPFIRANSDKVDIRVGNDYFIKGGWVLDSAKNPDVFSIGSKWPYKFKKVSFITDLDSISFEVRPGSDYDFSVLQNGATAHIRIHTLADPVFLNGTALAILFSFLTVLLLLLLYFRKRLAANKLILAGFGVPLLFWAMTFASAYIHSGYDHLRHTISELGAIGTRSELLTSVLLLPIAVLNILFCIGLYKTLSTRGLSTVPAVLSFGMPITFIWAAIFTLGNEFHSLSGPLPLLTIIAAGWAGLFWKDRGARIIALVSCLVMLLLLARFARPFGTRYEGLLQRFFYAGWTIWTMGLAWYLGWWMHRRY